MSDDTDCTELCSVCSHSNAMRICCALLRTCSWEYTFKFCQCVTFGIVSLDTFVDVSNAHTMDLDWLVTINHVFFSITV